jgi:hypothetical protein
MMSGMGVLACAVAYLVPLILLIVILEKNGIAKSQERTLPRSKPWVWSLRLATSERDYSSPAYLETATESTETVSLLTVPFTVTFSPASLSSSLSCPVSV